MVFDSSTYPTSKKRMLKYGIGAILIAAAVGFYVIRSFQGSFRYYMTVHEYVQLSKEGKIRLHEYVRVSGTVAKGSIRTETIPQSQLTFQIEEGGHTLDVVYPGIAPNNFKEDIPVVVEGTYAGPTSSFKAKTLITKCASKYSEGFSPLNSSPR